MCMQRADGESVRCMLFSISIAPAIPQNAKIRQQKRLTFPAFIIII